MLTMHKVKAIFDNFKFLTYVNNIVAKWDSHPDFTNVSTPIEELFKKYNKYLNHLFIFYNAIAIVNVVKTL